MIKVPMKNNRKVRIAVIDDGLDKEKLKELLNEETQINIHICDDLYNFSYDLYGLPINHCTICTALLLEGLIRHNIDKAVEITCIPITNYKGEKNLKNLILSLDYCAKQKFDIISMSIGLLNHLYTIPLINRINNVKDTIIVCAASNDFTITFPACLSAVIGVKRNRYNKENIIVKDPIDGIDMVKSYNDTSLLLNIKKKYKINYENSNSILVPQICAEIAKTMITSPKLIKGKTQLLNTIKGYTMKKIYNVSMSDSGIDKQEIPIISIEYTNKDYIIKKQITYIIKSELETKGFSCSIIHDRLTRSDFNNSWFKIETSSLCEHLKYYQRFLNDSFLILLIDNNNINNNIDNLLDLKLLNDNVINAVPHKEDIQRIIEHLLNSFEIEEDKDYEEEKN